MVKARTIYIFEGPETITITRGFPMEKFETSKGSFYSGRVKHRGLFRGFVNVDSMPSIYFGPPKKLYVQNKIIDTWSVVKVMFDYKTKEPLLLDISPSIISQIHSLKNEVEIWKRRCFEVEEKLLSMDNKDKFEEKLRKEMKKIGESRTLMYGGSQFGGGMESPYYRRWLGPSTSMVPSSED